MLISMVFDHFDQIEYKSVPTLKHHLSNFIIVMNSILVTICGLEIDKKEYKSIWKCREMTEV